MPPLGKHLPCVIHAGKGKGRADRQFGTVSHVGLKDRAGDAQWNLVGRMMRVVRAIPKPLWWLADFLTPKK